MKTEDKVKPITGLKKIDLNFAFVGLDGKDIPDTNAGKFLANSLAHNNKGDALKQYGIATRLYTGEPIELDKSDIDMIIEFVKSSEGFSNLSEAQILAVLQ
jgi:hypothetical protein